MNYLFVLDEYYPLKNANTNCASNIIERLAESNNITILSFSQKSGKKIISENIELIYFSFDYKRKKGIYDKAWKLFHYPLRNRELAYLYKKYIRCLLEKERYDAIIFVINPLESLYSITKVNFPRTTKTIIYELDSISDTIFNPAVLRPFLRAKSLLLEQKCYKKASAIIHMKCHQAYFEDSKYNAYRHKFGVADFPVLVDKNITEHKDSGKIRLVFAGSILKKVRNPLPAFDILLDLVNIRDNIEIEFYSKGDYENNIDNLNKKSNGSIIQKGFVDTSVLDDAIQQSDVLISIGNTFSSFAPSKVYEYLCWKKPIIHFYLIDDDPVLETFGSLGFVLFVDMRDSMGENVRKILNFIDRIGEFEFGTRDLFIMNRPEYTTKLMKDLLCDENK